MQKKKPRIFLSFPSFAASAVMVICLSLLPWERHSILKGQLRVVVVHFLITHRTN